MDIAVVSTLLGPVHLFLHHATNTAVDDKDEEGLHRRRSSSRHTRFCPFLSCGRSHHAARHKISELFDA